MSSSKSKKVDSKLLDALKHYDSFYEKPPPGLIKEDSEEKPEDVIPDLPENQSAREFLAKAPTKGLWMPLGKEVKVMKCWRCKIYGHRTGDKECPLFMSGNKDAEAFRHSHEDPMYNYVKENDMKQKMKKLEMLKTLLHSDKKKKKHKKKEKHKKHKRTKYSDSSSSSSSPSSSPSSSDSTSSYDSGDRNHREKRRKRKNKSSSKKHRNFKHKK